MTTGDIDDLNSLYKVNVDCGPGRSNYTLSDNQGVYIKKVEFESSDSDDRVETLQRILNDELGPQPHVGISPPVGIYYVKNATSAVDARNMMDAYSKNNTNYKKKKRAHKVRKYINHLNLPSHSKHSNLKTKSGGRRHQRRSRRGKGNGRGKKSRSSKTLRRSRR
jgi:hypothetical protein